MLKVIEQIKTHVTNNKKYIAPSLSSITFDHKSCELSGSNNTAIELKSGAILQVVHLVSEQEMLQNSDVLNKITYNSQRLIAKELFGEVEDRLFEILKELWKLGPAVDSKISEMVDDLIKDLRP